MNAIIVIVLLALLVGLVISVMRSRRRQWEEKERKRKEALAALDKALQQQMEATLKLNQVLAIEKARQAAFQSAQYAAEAKKANDQFNDEMQKKYASWPTGPGSRPTSVYDSRKIGKTAVDRLFESQRDEQNRRAFDQAMLNAAVTGLGVMRFSDAGTESTDSKSFSGSGGTFDGGGASGDYTPAPSSCDSSSSSSDSGSSSSSDSSSSCSSD